MRLKLATLLMFISAVGWSATTTTRLGMTIPDYGEQNWDVALRNDFNLLDATGAFVGQNNTFTGNNTFNSKVLATGGLQFGDGTNQTTAYNPSATLASYRRPVLKYVSSTVISIETGTAVQGSTATIIFPDGSAYNESQFGLYGATVTFTANWGNGTQQGGLRPTESLSANSYEAAYVVKSTQTLPSNTTDFVLVISTYLPIQSNFTNLNTFFGTNGWSYLGILRYGDNSAITTSILKFVQAGNTTTFYNAAAGQVLNMPGFPVVSAAATQAATYTYAVGTSSTSIPNNITDVYWRWYVESNTGSNSIKDATASIVLQTTSGSADHVNWVFSPAVAGLQASQNSGVNHKSDIFISGWIDNALGVGANPLF